MVKTGRMITGRLFERNQKTHLRYFNKNGNRLPISYNLDLSLSKTTLKK